MVEQKFEPCANANATSALPTSFYTDTQDEAQDSTSKEYRHGDNDEDDAQHVQGSELINEGDYGVDRALQGVQADGHPAQISAKRLVSLYL